MKPKYFDSAFQIWKGIAGSITEKKLDFNLDVHKHVLDIFQIGPYYYYIFNIKQVKFEYINPEMANILGYPISQISVPLVVNSIHPDDQSYFLNFENKVGEFFAGLTPEQIPNYKVSYDYRIRKSNNEYIRILQQSLAVDFDEKGQLLRALGIHTDITHLKPSGKPVLSFIGLNGEPSYYNIDVKEIFKTPNSFISTRERDVLAMLTKGLSSQQIADALFISKQTVDTHRKNLLSKLGCSNTAELISKVMHEGWI